MREMPHNTLTFLYRMDPRKIVSLKSLLDGYEGLVVVRTRDPGEGIVELLVSPDFEQQVRAIIEDIGKILWLQAV